MMFNNIRNNSTNFEGRKNFLLHSQKQLNSLAQDVNKNKFGNSIRNNTSRDTFISTNSQQQNLESIREKATMKSNNSKDYLSDIFGEDTDPITWFLGMIMP